MINEVQNRLQSRIFDLFYIPGIILTLHSFLKLFNSRCGVEEYLLIPPKAEWFAIQSKFLKCFYFKSFLQSPSHMVVGVGMHFLCTTLVQMSKL